MFLVARLFLSLEHEEENLVFSHNKLKTAAEENPKPLSGFKALAFTHGANRKA